MTWRNSTDDLLLGVDLCHLVRTGRSREDSALARDGVEAVATKGVAIDEMHIVRRGSKASLTQAVIDEVGRLHGYQTASASMDRLAFARSFRPTWSVTLAIVLAPTGVGLFFLLVRSTETFTCSIGEDHSGLRARLHGRVHPELLRRLRGLLDATDPRGAPNGSIAAAATPSAGLFSGVPGAPSAVPPAPGLAVRPPMPTGQITADVQAASTGMGAPVGHNIAAHPQNASFAFVPRSSLPSSPWLTPQPDQLGHSDESTRLVNGIGAGGQGAMRTLRLDDGRPFVIGACLLVGRNPSADPTTRSRSWYR